MLHTSCRVTGDKTGAAVNRADRQAGWKDRQDGRTDRIDQTGRINKYTDRTDIRDEHTYRLDGQNGAYKVETLTV